MGAQAGRRRGGLTKTGTVEGPKSSPLRHDVRPLPEMSGDPLKTRDVWETIYGHPLADDDLREIEGNLFRFIDLLASINGSILGTRELSTSDGDEAA